MDRQIKFRVWENVTKKFYYDMDYLQRNPSVKFSELFGSTDKSLRINHQWEPSLGLKVYTNDIIEVECAVSGKKTVKKRLARITYDGTGMGVTIWYKGQFWAYSKINWTTAKVVGNMYENHDLLK